MDKEELMKYANDPFWVRLRWFLFSLFWLLWAAMLVGAVLIIYAAPKCNPPPPRTWWQEGPLTEIESDTNPEYIKTVDKNIKGLFISWLDDAYNFNESYQIIKIIKQANELGKKAIIELDPATSYAWFEKSENKDVDFNDYYIWRPSTKLENLENPNLNMDNSSWKYSSSRKEFYYAPLGRPHLNFQNDNVIKAFSNVITKFLDYGASGIQIRNAPSLLIDSNFKSESLMELGPLLKQWKNVVKNKTGDGPFTIRDEMTNVPTFKVNETLVVDLPVRGQVFSNPTMSVTELVNYLNDTFNVSNIEWPLWKVNSTAFPKDVLEIVTYLLPGVPLVNSSDVINTQLLRMRQSPSIMRGICSIHSINNGTVFSYIRVTSGNPGILVAWNIKNETVTVNFPKDIPELNSITEVTVQLYSANFHETNFMSLNAKKDAQAVPISPNSVIVLSYVPKKKE